ncbi:MAG: DUF3299 domain-containing protein [Rubripirellula sp.]|jgi:hypothetical protein
MRLLRFALIVNSILLIGVSQATSPPLTSPQQDQKTSSPKTGGAGKVAAKPQADGVAQPTSEKPVSKTKVEVRKSSESARAKGDINFDDLSFTIEKDAKFNPALLTDDIKKLDGVKVKLRGYILPSTLFKETNIDQFVLVRDNQECCFGPGAALFDCVIVEMVPGNTTDFVTRPVTVEGKFKIDTEKYKYPNGVGPRGASHFAIFKIDGVKVK